MRRAPLAVAALLASAGVASAEIPRAVVVLHAPTAVRPGHVVEAMPPRFVMLEDGQVFVGGTSTLASVRLSDRERKDLDRKLADLRKNPALAGVVTVGPGPQSRRMVLRKGRPLEMTVEGDLAAAAPGLQPLAAAIRELETWHHPGLRPYAPAFYALSAKEGALPGGCRRWTRPDSLAEVVFAPKMVSASDYPTWPTGAAPASVCAGDKRYVVTLRPLLPGETP